MKRRKINFLKPNGPAVGIGDITTQEFGTPYGHDPIYKGDGTVSADYMTYHDRRVSQAVAENGGYLPENFDPDNF